MKTIKQSITIILSIALVFAIINTQLVDYIAQILSFLIITATLITVNKKRSKKDAEILAGSYSEVLTIILGILLLVFLTGGITSNIFFLVYFLLFGIAFMFEPITIFVFLISLIFLFVPLALKDDVFSNFIRIGSLALLSPLAYFFGIEFKKRESLEEEIETTAEEIVEDADGLLHSQNTKSEKDIEEINDILEKTETLREKANR